MLEAKPTPSPCPTSTQLSQLEGDSFPNPREFRSVVGALLYTSSYYYSLASSQTSSLIS
jgi:hypothetical protein